MKGQTVKEHKSMYSTRGWSRQKLDYLIKFFTARKILDFSVDDGWKIAKRYLKEFTKAIL